MKKTLKMILKVLMAIISIGCIIAGLICFVSMRAGYETYLVLGFIGFWGIGALLIWLILTI